MSLVDRSLETLDRLVEGMPNGECRPGQQEMTRITAEAIGRGGHAIVNAGTGTGKSLAYLIPVAHSSKRTVIVTVTKALQDQLVSKELPALSKHRFPLIRYTKLKGRNNYLCLQRLDEVLSDNPFTLAGLENTDKQIHKEKLRAVARFAETSKTGDRADLRVDLTDRQWRSLSVTAEECPGAIHCPRGEDCFTERARDKASRADVVVVNTHLFALSLKLQHLLADYETVVVDEAHQFEEIVAKALSNRLNPSRLTTLARNARNLKLDNEACTAIVEAAEELNKHLIPLSGKYLRNGVTDFSHILNAANRHVEKLHKELSEKISGIDVTIKPLAQRVLKSAQNLLDDLEVLTNPNNDNIFFWVEEIPPRSKMRSPTLNATPFQVGKLLADTVWNKKTAVLTSATITQSLRKSLGLPDSTRFADVGSPFDYRRNALLYCPIRLPLSGKEKTPQETARRLDELAALIEAAQGRTLALYTSYKALDAAAEAMRKRLSWPVLVQNSKPKARLLEEFTSNEHASLFATLAFWQGVDVPGRSCSLVVIDKLPFPRPGEPQRDARHGKVEEEGKNPFLLVDIPIATILFAQGVGRLIRTKTDRGVVAVFDHRLVTKPYGSNFEVLVPPMSFTENRWEAIDFLRAIISEGSPRQSDAKTRRPARNV